MSVNMFGYGNSKILFNDTVFQEINISRCCKEKAVLTNGVVKGKITWHTFDQTQVRVPLRVLTTGNNSIQHSTIISKNYQNMAVGCNYRNCHNMRSRHITIAGYYQSVVFCVCPSSRVKVHDIFFPQWFYIRKKYLVRHLPHYVNNKSNSQGLYWTTGIYWINKLDLLFINKLSGYLLFFLRFGVFGIPEEEIYKKYSRKSLQCARPSRR